MRQKSLQVLLRPARPATIILQQNHAGRILFPVDQNARGIAQRAFTKLELRTVLSIALINVVIQDNRYLQILIPSRAVSLPSNQHLKPSAFHRVLLHFRFPLSFHFTN